ncbi:hypothetical protein NLJ89_g9836 [Agrocybe chaxingu]|uniref:Uncharacterized protein n=1 Tax=Agrocybe chaxingu TaxID=84603 RepID=A0A9W8MPH3_9AGAR|nr:hypothetical protein NLJ89_g9836 [Agrocybe chaxingu]
MKFVDITSPLQPQRAAAASRNRVFGPAASAAPTQDEDIVFGVRGAPLQGCDEVGCGEAGGMDADAGTQFASSYNAVFERFAYPSPLPSLLIAPARSSQHPSPYASSTTYSDFWRMPSPLLDVCNLNHGFGRPANAVLCPPFPSSMRLVSTYCHPPTFIRGSFYTSSNTPTASSFDIGSFLCLQRGHVATFQLSYNGCMPDVFKLTEEVMRGLDRVPQTSCRALVYRHETSIPALKSPISTF